MNWTIPRDWEGETAFLLAGGPSLHGFDPSILSGWRSIAVNNSYLLHPAADILYFCDSAWYSQHRKSVTSSFRGQIVTLSRLIATRDAHVLQLKNMGKYGLSLDTAGLCHGSHSGYQAINLAFLLGASRIVLLGYDLRIWTWGDAADPDSYISITPQSEEQIESAISHIAARPDLYNQPFGTHWHAGHGAEAKIVERRLREVMLPPMSSLVQPLSDHKVEVINCTPKSAIPHWPFRRLEKVIEEQVPVESIGAGEVVAA